MTASPAILAATVVIVRDRAGAGPELLMVERASTMAFAAEMMVFPGGRVDEDDLAFGSRFANPLAGVIVAAVRETLEETAVPVALDPLPSPEQARTMQRALLEGSSLGAVLGAEGLTLDPRALTPFARWLPPRDIHRRFDTWFFLASAPAGQWEPVVGEQENRSAEWITATEALQRDSDGRAGLIFPTRCNLERLARYDSLSAMLTDAAAHPTEIVSPRIVDRDGERWLTIPDGLGYPRTAERLADVKRG